MLEAEGLLVLSHSDRRMVAEDITSAIEEIVRNPGAAERAIRILNNRLRPLGIRLELTGPIAQSEADDTQGNLPLSATIPR